MAVTGVLKKCADCGTVFVAENPASKYCPCCSARRNIPGPARGRLSVAAHGCHDTGRSGGGCRGAFLRRVARTGGRQKKKGERNNSPPDRRKEKEAWRK